MVQGSRCCLARAAFCPREGRLFSVRLQKILLYHHFFEGYVLKEVKKGIVCIIFIASQVFFRG